MPGYLPSSGGPAALDAALDDRIAADYDRSNGAALQGVHMQTIRPKRHIEVHLSL